MFGPRFGYYPNSKKTGLLDKPSSLLRLEMIFADTNISIYIVSEGVEYLKEATGSGSFVNDTLGRKVQMWSKEIAC